MDCGGFMLEDSIKIYIAEVVRGGSNRIRSNSILPAREWFSFQEHADASRSALSTLSSQILCDENEKESAERRLFLERNMHQLEFDLKSAISCKGASKKIICVVKETFPIKEIWIKGRRVWMAMGMMIMCDSFGYEVELLMWGKQCKNLLFVSNGSLVCMENIYTNDFQGHTTLRLNRNSRVLNLGHISGEIGLIDSITCDRFMIGCKKLIEKYPCFSAQCRLSTLSKQQPTCFSHFSKLVPCSITHIRAKVATLRMIGADVHSNKPFRITLSLREKAEHVSLYLHGSAKLWRKRLILQRTKVWEFYYLAVCTSQNESSELHTTFISSARPLFDGDDIASDCQKHVSIDDFGSLQQHTGRDFEGPFELNGVITEKVFINFGAKIVSLSTSCSAHLLQSCAEKCLKLFKKIEVRIVAMCYFKSDVSKQQFQIQIDVSKQKAQDLSKLIEVLLEKQNTMTVERVSNAMMEESTKETIELLFLEMSC